MTIGDNLQQSGGVNQRMSIQSWGLIFILAFFWGGSFFFVGVAVKELPPLTIVWCRVALAALILLSAIYLKGDRIPFTPRLWGGFIIMGALNNVIPFSLIAWGQIHIDSGIASILNATTPIFSVILTHWFTQEERLTPSRLMGVLIGWIGVAMLIGGDSFHRFGMDLFGKLAVLAAAFFYACSAIYGRRFRALSPLAVAAGMLCASAIMLAPVALWVEQPWHLRPGLETSLALFGLAAISTSLAYIIYFKVLAASGPTNLLLVTFLIPLSATGLGVLVLGEQLGWNSIAGMMIIFMGLMLIDGRILLKLKPRKTVWFYEI